MSDWHQHSKRRKTEVPRVVAASGSSAQPAAVSAEGHPVAYSSFYGTTDGASSKFAGGKGVERAARLDSIARSSVAPPKANPFPMLFNRTNSSGSLLNIAHGKLSPSSPSSNHTASNASDSPQQPTDFSSESRMRQIAQRFIATPFDASEAASSAVGGVRKGQAIKKMVQRGPAPARPVRDSFEFNMSRLRQIFPSFAESVLQSTLESKDNKFDVAADWLAEQDELALKNRSGATMTLSSSPIMISTSNRSFIKPVMSIREKFSNAQARNAIELSSDGESSIDSSSSAKIVKVVSKPKAKQAAKHSAVSDDEILESEGGTDSEAEVFQEQDMSAIEARLLEIFNTDSVEVIADVACCSEELANEIIKERAYMDLDEVRRVDIVAVKPEAAAAGVKKARRQKRAAGEKAVDTALETLTGYEAVDSLIHRCDQVGRSVSKSINDWGVDVRGSNGELEICQVDDSSSEDEVDGSPKKSRQKTLGGGYFPDRPALLANDVVLKDYQQVGINWLTLLYKKRLSCILADEMGLGKTCQVIAFLAHLKEVGINGPHLVVVPSSTLENWLREFNRFCPSLNVEPYYGTQKERQDVRMYLSDPDNKFDMLVTTYNLACGSPLDCSFLRNFKFNTCVYDEGHLLKNSASERYQKLMRLKAEFRLLLTGTPLQNNLQELVSLLAFILPNIFKDKKEDLIGVFKHKAKTTSDSGDVSNMALLSQQRISRAKTMMTPFVLRRKKDQVLKHLPKKHHRVEYCDMVLEQKEIYETELEESRKVIAAREAGKVLTKNDRASSNVLMRLRKAALHPLLFRRHYDEKMLRKMAKDIMKEERYNEANVDYIFEDMEVMSDFELHNLCMKFESVQKYRLQADEWMVSGKVAKLKEIVTEHRAKGDRVLIFSQFTQVLDILEPVLSTLGLSFLRLDGSTSVELRQDLIDKFYEEEDITCFLLSTKAGGFGINLACANVVVIFDMSFNPHDDRQAEDRAHRVGQTREVEVVRLVTRGTIEEAILQLANTKIALDKSVSEDANAEESNAKEVERMMFSKHD
ncbi:SNF2 family N-terminal domain-containing protein [Limtongia smithiae]|uniref:SNF2 family N-terminal domain-containing protein n=1 Tax=Limtongia smithiae TaxID=1125753 RepID=UPI0034CEA7A9